jgi:hypothetical protein
MVAPAADVTDGFPDTEAQAGLLSRDMEDHNGHRVLINRLSAPKVAGYATDKITSGITPKISLRLS